MTLISNSRRFILDLTIFGIRGTWVGWVDPEMVLDDLYVSSSHRAGGYIFSTETSDFTHWKVGAYWSLAGSHTGHSTYGWDSIKITVSAYIGPTSGTQDCAVSVWLAFTSGSAGFPPLNPTEDFGSSGDTYGVWNCIGIVGYYGGITSRSLIRSLSQLPQEPIKGLFLYSRQLVPRSVNFPSGVDWYDYWFDGNATVTVTLTT